MPTSSYAQAFQTFAQDYGLAEKWLDNVVVVVVKKPYSSLSTVLRTTAHITFY